MSRDPLRGVDVDRAAGEDAVSVNGTRTTSPETVTENEIVDGDLASSHREGLAH